MVAAPVVLLVVVVVVVVVVVTLGRGPLDPRYQALGGPFDLRGFSGVVLVANQVALAVTILAVVVAAGSLVGRFGRARGVERLQLRWAPQSCSPGRPASASRSYRWRSARRSSAIGSTTWTASSAAH